MIELKNLKHGRPEDIQRLELGWKTLLTRKDVGFPGLPDQADGWAQTVKRVKELNGVSRLILVGIGGSSLGPRVIYDVFKHRSMCEIFFLESLDPINWANLKGLGPEWKKAHVAIVSKSGGTLETLTWAEKLNAEGYLDFKNTTVIASPGKGALQEWAAANGIPTLWIPENIGGRFSVLTAVGMLPAGLMGLDLEAFRTGAALAVSQPRKAAQLGAEILQAFERGQWITQMWTYFEALGSFGQWWQQLWGESLAKKLTRDGKKAPRVSTPMTCVGSRDQHSVLQQLSEGERDKHVLVLRVDGAGGQDTAFAPKQFSALPYFPRALSLQSILDREAEAFEHSLTEDQVPFCGLHLNGLNEKSLGALFMFWQMVIGQMGEVLGLNAFDQPGVESAKKHATQMLRQ